MDLRMLDRHHFTMWAGHLVDARRGVGAGDHQATVRGLDTDGHGVVLRTFPDVDVVLGVSLANGEPTKALSCGTACQNAHFSVPVEVPAHG